MDRNTTYNNPLLTIAERDRISHIIILCISELQAAGLPHVGAIVDALLSEIKSGVPYSGVGIKLAIDEAKGSIALAHLKGFGDE